MKAIFTIILVSALFIPYVWNFIKLTECDFEPDYKCEVIHAIGIIPPLSYITVWFGTDDA